MQNLRSGLAYATTIVLLVSLVGFPTLYAYAVNPLVITKTSGGITQNDGNPAHVPDGGIVQICNHKANPITYTVTVNGVVTATGTIPPGQCVSLTVGSPQLPRGNYSVHDPTDTVDIIGTSDPTLADTAFDFTISLAPLTVTNTLGGTHTVTATVTDISGAPVSSVTVTFTILSGPNAGKTGTGVTDASGIATFTYSDSGGAGTDTIKASFIDPTGAHSSNIVNKIWVATTISPVGGIIIPVDMTSLFVAGAMTNAFWVLPTLGGITGAAIALFKVKRKHI